MGEARSLIVQVPKSRVFQAVWLRLLRCARNDMPGARNVIARSTATKQSQSQLVAELAVDNSRCAWPSGIAFFALRANSRAAY